MPQTVTMEDVVDSGMDQALTDTWTAIPAIVQSYDASLQRINGLVAVQSAYIDENGDRATEQVTVTGVPVVHYGGNGFRVVTPLKPGDSVLLVVCARSIDQWLAKGGIADPFFDHHHDLSDAVAIPGLRDFAHPLKNSPTDHASVGYDTGATIEFRPNEIRAGGDDASSNDHRVVIQSALNDFMSALGTAIGTVTTDPSASAALNALKTALLGLHSGGWLANTTVLKAK